MGPRDMLALTGRVKALCQLFGTSYSQEIDDAYYRCVQDIDAAAVNKALDLLELTSKFMPKPVEVREAALAVGNPSIAPRCPAGAKLFPPRYPVAVEGHGVVAKIGEHGGFAVRNGSRWSICELTGSAGNGSREIWSGGQRDAGAAP